MPGRLNERYERIRNRTAEPDLPEPDVAGVGDAAGLQNSAAAGSLYVSLHTADPGEAGEQTTSETAYTNYARVAVARSAAGWTVAGNNASNAAAVAFPACGATGGRAVTFGSSFLKVIGTVDAGASKWSKIEITARTATHLVAEIVSAS